MVRLKRSSAIFALFCTDSATSPAASLACPYKSSTSPTTLLALPCNCIFLSPVTLPTNSCVLPPKFLAVPPILFSSMLRSCEVRIYVFVIEHAYKPFQLSNLVLRHHLWHERLPRFCHSTPSPPLPR